MSDFKDDLSIPQMESTAPPPTYAAAPPSYSDIPPDVTAGFANLTLDDRMSGKPTVDQCIAHLKLLECFHELRETVATTDGLYGIKDDYASSAANESSRASLLTKIREKRWSIYVTQAVKRFELWWTNCIEPHGYHPQPLKNARNPALWKVRLTPFTKTNLPPIDVLMVWHTFMLNPRDYLSDCIRFGKQGLWTTGFPWHIINTCINDETFEYETSKEGCENFERCTGKPYNALEMPSEIDMKCPKCARVIVCPLTTCRYASNWDDAPFFKAGESGHGFADKIFNSTCPDRACRFMIDHEQLRVRKFYGDVLHLREVGAPMPGTILDEKGQFGESKGSRAQVEFPNRLLRIGGLDAEVFAALDPKQLYPRVRTVTDIRTLIEKALKNGHMLRKANDSFSKQLQRGERVAIRRMMACYWDNSSIFSIDLAGAVIRQGTFIEKMHSIDWLHSPSIRATMDRLLTKYSRFFAIMAAYPLKVAVPTLDVDLAWHTHQLSPQAYYTYATNKTKQFIDHDDKIDETRLSDAFEWTSKTYQRMFDDVYSECTCWYCEAIRESHHSVMDRIVGNPKVNASLDRLHSTEGTDNPHTNPHISAHNAIQVDGSSDRKLDRSIKAATLESHYQKACRRALKKGRQPPSRDEYVKTTYAYGHPVTVPYYAPYMGDPCLSSGMYASNPACASVAPGATGNCCSGTCGGMVAAGGTCGGSSAGGCAGGSAGGCGGGGGGGGGGGCGGGGGGGGGGGC